MGVDFVNCDGCKEIFCANGGSHNCENCYNTYCNWCANDNLIYWADEGLFCSACDTHEQLPDPSDKELLDWILVHYLHKSRYEIIREFNENKSISSVDCNTCDVDKYGCESILDNYLPLKEGQSKEFYTLDYTKESWTGEKEYPYMRPKGCCCICNPENGLCDLCESRKEIKTN